MAFERGVVNILRLLGYSVERNVMVHGCQIDMYATFSTGAITLRLMIECKDYRHGQMVGVKEIKEFAGALHPALGPIVDKGLIVTSSDFTREAKNLAAASGIDAVRLCDLEHRLVNFDSYLDRVVDEHRNSAAYRFYIDLSATSIEDYVGADFSSFVRPIDLAVNRILFEENKPKLALLGNFGTGKTTFCKKYAHDLALRYKAAPDDRNNRLPVVVQLSDYESRLDIQELITNTFQFRYGVRIDIAVCEQMQRLGRLLILLDGLDEMAMRVDPEVVKDNIRELNKLARIPENKFIMTCRTHFFRDRVQAEVLEDFDILYIPEWGETEISEYLQKRFGQNWREQLHKIHGTHNLQELAQTPLFLEMLTETLPRLGKEVTRCELYEAYTEKWIVKQSRRRGARLPAETRRALVREMAVKLYCEDRATYHYTEFAPYLQKKFKLTDATRIDYLENDLRTCTFLTRDAEGEYGFKHKSFMEFFVAQVLADEARSGLADCVCKKIAPPEVLGFTVELMRDSPPAVTLKTWAGSGKDDVLRQNALSLLIRLGVPLDGVTLAEETKTDMELRLVARFMQGDKEACNTVFSIYPPRIASWLKRHYRGRVSQDEANDAVVDVLLRILETRDTLSFTRPGAFENYLATAANKLIRSLRRNRMLRKVVSPKVLVNIPASQEEMPAVERSDLIQNALLKLTCIERQIVERNVLGYLTNAEVAADLGISIVQLQRFKRRALRKLSGFLKEDDTLFPKAL